MKYHVGAENAQHELCLHENYRDRWVLVAHSLDEMVALRVTSDSELIFALDGKSHRNRSTAGSILHGQVCVKRTEFDQPEDGTTPSSSLQMEASYFAVLRRKSNAEMLH